MGNQALNQSPEVLRRKLADTSLSTGANIVARSTITVDSVEQLRDLGDEITSANEISLRGYYADEPGEGGGILVPVADGADNGGTIFATIGNRKFQRKGDKTLCLKDFGIMGRDFDDDRLDDLVYHLNEEAVGARTILGAPDKLIEWDNGQKIITRSNVTLDFQGGIITCGNSRFVFNGDVGVAGDNSGQLNNVWFKNAFVGVGVRASISDPGRDISKAVDFYWCRNSGVMNVIKDAEGGTAFYAYNCRRMRYQNITNWGSRPIAEGGAIGLLLHMCDDTYVNNMVIGGPGEWFIAVQIKGGRRNHISNVTAMDMVGNGDPISSRQRGFYDRGDDPYNPSDSDGIGLTYRYTTLGWSVADDRRRSIDTVFENCKMVNCPEHDGFLSREAYGTKFLSNRVIGGGRKTMFLEKRGSGDGGYVVEDFTTTGSSEYGLDVDSISGQIEDIDIKKVRIYSATGVGARVNSCNSPKINDVAIKTVTGVAMALNGVNSPRINDIKISGNQTYGLVINANCTDVSLSKFEAPYGVDGNPGLSTKVVGRYKHIDSAVTGTSTAANYFGTIGINIPVGEKHYVTADVIGKISGGGEFVAKISAIFKNDSGTVTRVGSSVVNTSTGHDANWEALLEVTSGEPRIRVRRTVAGDVSWAVKWTTEKM